jgi:hypothetical protein
MLAVILCIIGALAFLAGLVAAATGASAVHQILCAVYFLTFTVCVSGLGIMAAVAEVNATTKSEWNDYAKYLVAHKPTSAKPVAPPA